MLQRNKSNGTNMSYDPRSSFREIMTQKNYNKNFGNLYASINNYNNSYNNSQTNTKEETDSIICTIQRVKNLRRKNNRREDDYRK